MTEGEPASPLDQDFSCYVLFSERLVATFEELLEAAEEDYPGLDWGHTNLGVSKIDTSGVTLAVDSTGQLKIVGMPGPVSVDWKPSLKNSRLSFPEAHEAIAAHTDHLMISCASKNGATDVASRFEAARQLACLSAVLAKLPIALAVYVPGSGGLVRPAVWAQGAEISMDNKVPSHAWFSLCIQAFDEPPDPLPVSVQTVGLAQFLECEIAIPKARMDFKEAATFAVGVCSMLLDADHNFSDGDTMGTAADDKAFRIRHCPKGKFGAPTDQWWMIHSNADLDHEELFGAPSNEPPPEGMDNSMVGDWSTLEARLKNRLQ